MIKDALGGNKEEAIRNRASGRDTDTQVYINRSKEQKKIEKPADQSICTLWVGATEGVTEADLVDAFYSYGELKAVRLANNCAFVEFADRESAERAADAKYRNLVIKGNSLPLDWARPRGGPVAEARCGRGGPARRAPGPTGACAAPGARRGLWSRATGRGGASPQKKARRPPHAPRPVHGPEPARVAAAPGRRRRGRRVGGAGSVFVFRPRRRVRLTERASKPALLALAPRLSWRVTTL